MPSPPESLESQRFSVSGSFDDAVEFCYAQGWTDGLPAIPPTQDKVRGFLDAAGKEPFDVIGIEPVRKRVITAEKVAINAVMAGCRPEYMPVVIAALDGMLAPRYNLHASGISSDGPATLLVINGTIRQKLAFNSAYNLFGSGPHHRANATIGRAIGLILINVLGNHPGTLDRSTLGHPGKFTYCIAETEENSPWAPLHVERGFPPEASTVTVFAALGPTELDSHGGGTPEALLASVAYTMMGFGPGHEEMILVISPEHMGFIREAGWSKGQVRNFLFQKARMTAQEWAKVHKAETPTPGTEKDPLPALASPESLVLIMGGGFGGHWSALIPTWGKGKSSHSVTREIDVSRLP